MNLIKSLNISASGLSAERLRMDVISSNIANANSTRTEGGGPYRRQVALLSPRNDRENFQKILDNKVNRLFSCGGVKVSGVVQDSTPFKRVYDPEHPDASEDGYVEYTNVNVMKEMIELMTASRSYEANVTAFNATKSMFSKTLEI
ncbi:MAG: flagellar basal body rod protein FlgC [Clostridia bacterium]|nr:flagellar basal body rod protein FlgC [Clostridia bacterium]MDD4048295.1 flagellar basal body rod protein FlgC [Clostridia bacterium]